MVYVALPFTIFAIISTFTFGTKSVSLWKKCFFSDSVSLSPFFSVYFFARGNVKRRQPKTEKENKKRRRIKMGMEIPSSQKYNTERKKGIQRKKKRKEEIDGKSDWIY